MLGRGHLSKLRQGHGSWPDRENLYGTPVPGREDMILIDGQLERDSLLDFYPKSRAQKHFSPPKRPWDFSKVSKPTRLWEFSPSFCKERLQLNTRSTRRNRDSREQYCGSVNAVHTKGGIQNHLSSGHRSRVCQEESGDSTAARRSQATEPRTHASEANMRQGFWSTTNNALFMEPAESQDQDLQSSLDHRGNSFTKAVTEEQSKASQLNAKVAFEIEEIETLKAQMALLCEKLACHMSYCNNGQPSKGGLKSFDCEDSLLFKGRGELFSVQPTESFEFRREQEKAFAVQYAGSQEIGEICRCRNLAWKSGIGIFFQAILWCSGFTMTIVRCTRGGPELIPT